MVSAWYVDERVAPPEMAPTRLREHLETGLYDLNPLEPLSLRPFVLKREVYDDIYRGESLILPLLRRALFERGPDIGARAEALGVDRELYYPLTVPGPLEDEYATCMTRPDVVIDRDGPKFVEFNIGGGLGLAVETSIASQLWLSLYGMTDRLAVSSVDTMAIRDSFFVRVAAATGVRPAVLVVGSRRAVPGVTSRHFDLQVDSLRRHGLESEFVEPEDLPRYTSPASGRPYRLGLRYFTVSHWRELGIGLEPVRQALDDGCLLLTTQTAYAVANKKVLAWVSEGRPWMTKADLAAIERYLPWTRLVEDRPCSWQGSTYDLPELLLRRRESFVLKPTTGWRGRGVMIGRSTDQGEWAALVEKALGSGDHIVQELVDAVPHELEFSPAGDERFSGTVYPVFGPFLFDGQPGGMSVKYLRPGQWGVVGSVTGNSLLSVVLRSRL